MKNCTTRKHEYRVHEKLSNSQWLNLYFAKHATGEKINVWSVGLAISKTVRQANDWWRCDRKGDSINYRSTGRCGLEGLYKALQYVVGFVDLLKINEEIQVEWADQRRKEVYGRLVRYGFREYGNNYYPCYANRNPKYWERSDKWDI